MKTKIIYISGNEVFDVKDIRAAFEEVRNALNLDKTTVLFGVPVDADDAGLMPNEQPETVNEIETAIENIPEPVEPVDEEQDIIPETPEEIITVDEEIIIEPVIEETRKKRGRPHKEEIVDEQVVEQTCTDETDEKIVPILSILSTKSEPDEEITVTQETETVEIIQEISEEKPEDIVAEETIDDKDEAIDDDDEADLEKLLSAMTPLAEDITEDKKLKETIIEPIDNEDDVSVDATLEQLATEFAETQDKIATENKSASRSKIGKLRNILPFKQSKHKDQGLGDLFGWAGVAANDEDFSVPGFFTNAASKK